MNQHSKKTLTLLITIGMLLSILHTAVSFAEEDQTKIPYTVTYLPGGADVTGEVPVDENIYGYNDLAAVKNQGTLSRPGYSFTGWKAEAQCAVLTIQVAPFINKAPESIKALGTEIEELFLSGYAIKGYLWSDQDLSNQFMCTQAVPTDQEGVGELVFQNIPYGTYLLMIKRNGTLVYLTKVVVTEKEAVFQSAGIDWFPIKPGVVSPPDEYPEDGIVRLIVGDVNMDFMLDMSDISNFNAYRGKTFEDLVINSGGLPHIADIYAKMNFYAGFDINADGIIGTDDYTAGTFALLNFGPMYFFSYRDTLNLFDDYTYLNEIGAGYDLLTVLYSRRNETLTSWNNFEIDAAYQPNDIFRMPGGDVVLTAQWSVNLGPAYRITYLLNGGTNTTFAPDSYTAAKLPLTIADPCRADYSFLGWTISYANGPFISVPTKSYVIPGGTTGDVTFTAHWLRDTVEFTRYTITYADTGHTAGEVPIDYHNPYDSSSMVSVLSHGGLVREGYTFLGWTARSDDINTVVYLEDSTFSIFSDTVLYAVWQKLPTYTVTFKSGLHGSFTDYIAETELVYAVVSGGLTPQTPKLAGESGWMFAGWSPVVASVVTQDVVYVAQWSPIVYTVTYAPGTQGTFAAQVYAGLVYGTVTPAFAGTPFGTSGYTFAGWTPTITTTVTADTVYTAQWNTNNAPSSNSGGSGSGSSGSSPIKPSIIPQPPVVLSPPAPLSITPQDTPALIVNDDGSLQTWALVNLILSIAGLIIVVIVTGCVLLQRKQKQKKQQTTPKNANNKHITKQNNADETEQKQKHHRKLWLITTAVLGIAGIIVFLFTEDISRPMTLVDRWTIVNAIIFITEIITAALIFKHKKNNNNDNKNNQTTTPANNNINRKQ